MTGLTAQLVDVQFHIVLDEEKQMQPKYEEDFYGWTMANVSLLKQGKLKEADMEHIIEELEEMGNSKENELFSRLAVLLTHLLKWQFQSKRISRSWKDTLEVQRFRIKRLLRKNPGLKHELNETFQDAYKAGVLQATKETRLKKDTFPIESPYTFEQCLDDEFFPE